MTLPNDAPLISARTNPPLGMQTAHGFVWLLCQTVGSKAFSFVTQIALARLLVPHDFGLVALAYTAVSFAGVIRWTGIQQILVQRQKHLRRWENSAFWFELAISVAAAVLLVVTSPVAALIFRSRALVGLIAVIAASVPLSPWYVIPNARLTIGMRFRTIAMANIAYSAALMLASIALAWCGFGAYSFVLPLPLAGIIRATWLWWASRPKIRLDLQVRRWKYMVGDSGHLVATGFLNSVMFQAGCLVLGIMQSKAVVGEFFFALNLSMQIAQLLSQNLGSVLLPALSRLQDEAARHAEALIGASRLLAFGSTPLCLLLAAASRPLVVTVYGAKWLPAVPLLQIMAVTVAVAVPSGPATTALQSQGRFSLLFRWAAAQAPCLVVFVVIGSWLGGAVGVALLWLAFAVIASPITIALAVGPARAARAILAIYGGPFAAGAATLIVLALVTRLFPHQAAHGPIWLGAVALSIGVAYPLGSLAFCRRELGLFVGYVRSAAVRAMRCR